MTRIREHRRTIIVGFVGLFLWTAAAFFPAPSWAGETRPGNECLIDVTDAPRAVATRIATAARFMRSRGYRVRDVPVWVASNEQMRRCAQAEAFVDSEGMTISAKVAKLLRQDDPGYHWLIRHELAHTASDMTAPRQLWSEGEQQAAEGAADAAATDTNFPYMTRVLGWPVSIDFEAYPAYHAMVRGMSQRATRRPADSSAAVAWRRAYVNAPRGRRLAMWEAANARHAAKLAAAR